MSLSTFRLVLYYFLLACAAFSAVLVFLVISGIVTVYSEYVYLLLLDIIVYDILAAYVLRSTIGILYGSIFYTAARIAADALTHRYGHAQLLCVVLLILIVCLGCYRVIYANKRLPDEK
jgi:hypothetical protein